MKTDLVSRTDRLAVTSVKVDETDDFWIVEQSIATRPGVFNGARRDKEELARSYSWLENVPIGVNHPDDDAVHHGLLYVFPEEIHGFAANVDFNDETGEITYDAYLFRRPDVPGYNTTPDVVAENKLIVDAIRRGTPIDNSPGYLTRVTPEKGSVDGKAYEEVRRDFMFYHVAIVPQGACGWNDVCGLGRAAADQRGGPLTGQNPNPKPAADCGQGQQTAAADNATAARIDVLEKKLDASTSKVDALVALLESERKATGDARLAEKRGKLAKLRKVDAKTLEAYPESVLDAEIQREEALSAGARGDNAHFDASRGADENTDATARPTVGAWDAAKGTWSA